MCFIDQENVPPLSSNSHIKWFHFRERCFHHKKQITLMHTTKETWQKWTKFLLLEQPCFQKNFQMETKNMDRRMLATAWTFVSEIFIERNFFYKFSVNWFSFVNPTKFCSTIPFCWLAELFSNCKKEKTWNQLVIFFSTCSVRKRVDNFLHKFATVWKQKAVHFINRCVVVQSPSYFCTLLLILNIILLRYFSIRGWVLKTLSCSALCWEYPARNRSLLRTNADPST